MCDSNPKSDIYKYWTRDIQCNTNYGECDFVNHVCICHDGYTHDLSYVRLRGCQVPVLFYPIAYGIQLACSLLLLPYVIYKYKQSKSMARISLQCNIIACISHILYCSILISNNYIVSSITLILLFLIASSFSAAKYIEMYSFISPLASVARKSIEPIKYTFIASFVIYRIIELMTVSVASVYYSDSTNINNDLSWSKWAMSLSLLIAFEGTTLVLFLVVHAKKMLSLIDNISSAKKSTGVHHSERSNEYLLKVRKMITRSTIFFPPMMMIMMLTPIIIFTTNFLPGSFFFAALSAYGVLAVILISAIFASKTEKKAIDPNGDPSSTTTNRPKDQITNQVGSDSVSPTN